MSYTLKMNYDFPEAEGLVFCGDIHGKFDELVYRMTNLCRMEHTVVIVAGDCGFGFHRRGYYDEVYRRVLPKLERADCHVVFVRGNHDNPAYFDGEEINMKRWVAVKDYSTVTVANHRVLCVGGATSVDRKNREDFIPLEIKTQQLLETPEMRRSRLYMEYENRFEPADFWRNEQPYLDWSVPSQLYFAGKMVDTVVTHIPPSMCEDVTPPSWLEYLIENDQTLLNDMRNDRKEMDALLERLRKYGHPVRHWLYGHYHHSWQANIDGIQYTMLKEMEMKELR